MNLTDVVQRTKYIPQMIVENYIKYYSPTYAYSLQMYLPFKLLNKNSV
jgi:hypothetical protein